MSLVMNYGVTIQQVFGSAFLRTAILSTTRYLVRVHLGGELNKNLIQKGRKNDAVHCGHVTDSDVGGNNIT